MKGSALSDDWMDDFYGREPSTPPPTPDKSLLAAIEEGNESYPVPRLSPPPHAQKAGAATGTLNPPYLTSARRRLVDHTPAAVAPEITVARRQYYSREQQALFREQRGDALTTLAKAAGKKKKKRRTTTKKSGAVAAPEERWVTTRNGRVLKLPVKKEEKR